MTDKGPIIVSVRKVKCPVCGYECASNQGLEITLPPYSGTYCLACWAKGLAESVPKMEPVE